MILAVVIVVVLFAGSVVLATARGILADELRAWLHRRLTRRLDRMIAVLPPELRNEYGDEWRAEMATMASTPIYAWRFLRGLVNSDADLRDAAGVIIVAREQSATWTRRAHDFWRWSQGTRTGALLTGPTFVAALGPGPTSFALGNGIVHSHGAAAFFLNEGVWALVGFACGVLILATRGAVLAANGMLSVTSPAPTRTIPAAHMLQWMINPNDAHNVAIWTMAQSPPERTWTPKELAAEEARHGWVRDPSITRTLEELVDDRRQIWRAGRRRYRIGPPDEL